MTSKPVKLLQISRLNHYHPFIKDPASYLETNMADINMTDLWSRLYSPFDYFFYIICESFDNLKFASMHFVQIYTLEPNFKDLPSTETFFSELPPHTETFNSMGQPTTEV